MDKLLKLLKQLQDETKLALLDLDKYLSKKHTPVIDHIVISCNTEIFSTIKSALDERTLTISEETGSYILLLNNSLDIAADQKVDKLVFNIEKADDFQLKSVAFAVAEVVDLNLELQKHGVSVGKIEKVGNYKQFIVRTEGPSLIFMNRPYAQEEEIIALKNKLNEEKDSKIRVMADFQNYKKRVEKFQKEMSDMANQHLINQVIDVIDDCNRAINNEQKNGVAILLDKLKSLLKEQGLVELAISIGQKFNPEQMEALSVIPAGENKKSNTVIHIDQLGYKYINSDRLYRPARVIVAK